MPHSRQPRQVEQAFRADWARSSRLLRAFGAEQSDPDRFYGELAADSAAQVNRFHNLAGSLMVDVGGGPGYFAEAFGERGATYVAIDADAGEMRLHGRSPGPRTIQARGTQLPFADGCFDLAYTSNVLEHVAHPWRMADDMVRVTRPGGTVVMSYTLWFGPWGGHETSPWHLLGGHYAARRYAAAHGRGPKNVFGETMFAVTAGSGLRWARECPHVDLVAAVPRYLPASVAWLTKVPGLREVATWNLMLVLRRRPGDS